MDARKVTGADDALLTDGVPADAGAQAPAGGVRPQGMRPQVKAVTVVVFLVYMSQMMLSPVLSPLARELGLAEWQLGLTISVAAIMVVLTSQSWGRHAQSHGARRVLGQAVALAGTAMVAFVATAWAGTTGLLGTGLVFVLVLAIRGLAFGASMAAVAPTAQTYIAKVTGTEHERVKGMAGLGAAQGMAMVFGAGLGGALAAFGLLVSLAFVPVLLVIGLVVVSRLRPEPVGVAVEKAPWVSPRDPRVWPFLVAGFGMFTSLGFIQVITGFMVQDRFGLGAEATGLATGGTLLAAGIGQIVAQALIVPRSGWAPFKLLRIGSAVALVGFVMLIPNAGAVVFVTSIFVIGFGLGIATPGYTAGPSLLMKRREQGGLAGTLGMNNGLTFVLAPTIGTVTYGIGHVLPVVIGAVVMGLVVCFVWMHPAVRQRPEAESLPLPDAV
ncbi:MFS transporter [Brooklawnia sp.]|uniref:MFS transporter n=1 Tax=Brooklawnia sp. TaxID=2699740 RepID=UPI00311EB84B